MLNVKEKMCISRDLCYLRSFSKADFKKNNAFEKNVQENSIQCKTKTV